MSTDLRERVLLPIGVPVVILILFVGGAYALSRVLMTVPAIAATIAVFAVAAVTVAIIAYVAARDRVRATVSAATVGGVLVVVLAAGAVSAVAGPRAELAELMAVAVADEARFVAIDVDFAEAPEALPPGEHEVVLENQGRTRHSVVFRELGDDRVVLARPGETVTGTVSLEPGEYYFYCDIADHEDRGMFGTLEVMDR